MVIELSLANVIAAISITYGVYQSICWLLDRYHIGEKRKEYQLIKESNKVLMREVIRSAHIEYMAQDWIDEDELEHLEKVYALYHNLKGNGTGDRWMKELRELPRK